MPWLYGIETQSYYFTQFMPELDVVLKQFNYEGMIVAITSQEAQKMYLTLQEFLSRYGGNFENNLKNSSEIAKTFYKGKIILNPHNDSGKALRQSI
jgi:predicted SpoU family rRNA methylase